jgi:hypothetical protein
MEYNPPARIFYDMARPSWKKMARGWLGVAVGVLTDLVGTNLVSGVYILALALQNASALAAQHVPQGEIPMRVMREYYAHWAASLPVLAIGLAFSLLGGFAAGRFARCAEVGFGACAGFGAAIASIVITLYFRLPTAPAPFWRSFFCLVLSLGACTLGGLLAYIIRKRTKPAQPDLEKEIGANLKSGFPHARYGIASMAFGLVGALGACVSLASILFFTIQKDHSAVQVNTSLASIVFLGMLLPVLIGVSLGIVGIFERQRKKVLAVAGFLLNTASLAGIVLVIWLSGRLNIPK